MFPTDNIVIVGYITQANTTQFMKRHHSANTEAGLYPRHTQDLTYFATGFHAASVTCFFC